MLRLSLLPVLVVSGVNDHRKIVISLMVAMGNFYAVLLRTVTPIFAISSMPSVANPRDIVARYAIGGLSLQR